MIFRQIPQILRGQKTQTRRVVKLNESHGGDSGPNGHIDIINVYGGGRLKWEVEQTYAIVPKRGSPAISFYRIRLTSIRKEQLQDITDADAKAEGVQSVEEYRALWESINGKTPGARWADNPMVWVLTFDLVRNG